MGKNMINGDDIKNKFPLLIIISVAGACVWCVCVCVCIYIWEIKKERIYLEIYVGM